MRAGEQRGGLWAMAVLAAVAIPAAARSETGALPKAEKAFADLKYADADKALDQVLAAPGNERATLLRALELSGIVSAILNQPAKARDRFRTLVSLDPDHRLPGDFPPRVTTPFAEAKTWLVSHPPLSAEGSARPKPGGAAMVVTVKSDPLGLARKVRFTLRPKGGLEARGEAVPLEKGQAAAEAKGPADWWAEVLGERDAILLAVGSERAPLGAQPAPEAPPPIAKAEPKPEPKVEARPKLPPPPAIAEAGRVAPERPVSTARIASYTAAGAGVAALGVGGFFGWRASDARSQIDGAARNGKGEITGLTQKQAYELDAAAQRDARIANSLFIAGGLLAAGGAALFFYDWKLAPVPTPNGVALSGRF